MSRPEPGDPVPPFEMTADDGSAVSSESLAGHRYVIYFYPEDDTAGCTRQACSMRDNFDRVTATGVEVFGVSPDSVASHVRFRKKFDLPFRLLSDDGHTVADAFGTWVEKVFAGKTYMGIERAAFLIGEDGALRNVWYKISPKDTPTRLLEALGE